MQCVQLFVLPRNSRQTAVQHWHEISVFNRADGVHVSDVGLAFNLDAIIDMFLEMFHLIFIVSILQEK